MPQAPARRSTRESSDVARLVRLHHRRRGWAWVAAGSLIGLAVFVGIDVDLFGNLTGTTEILSVIPAFVLLALVLAGLAVVVVDTWRIRRADAAVRVGARGSVSHHPLYAHAHRYPPHHRGSWVFAIVMLVAMTGITVFLLPAEVNSWAYVAGAENRDTFNPVSYGPACVTYPRRGCHTVTEGYLSSSGAQVTWGSIVPLVQRLPHRWLVQVVRRAAGSADVSAWPASVSRAASAVRRLATAACLARAQGGGPPWALHHDQWAWAMCRVAEC